MIRIDGIEKVEVDTAFDNEDFFSAGILSDPARRKLYDQPLRRVARFTTARSLPSSRSQSQTTGYSYDP
jgi:hypothetical protein